jgi:hypothetical protein
MNWYHSCRRLSIYPNIFFNRYFGLLLIFLFLVGLDACASRQLAVRAVTDIINEGLIAYESDNDLEMLKSALPSHIKLLETLLVSDPNNQKLLILLARSYASYAFIFYEGQIEAARLRSTPGVNHRALMRELSVSASGYYNKGIEYALRAMEIRHPDCRQKLGHIASSGPFIQTMGKDDLPALFWYGFNLSAAINLNRESIAFLAKAHQVEKSMQRAIEIDSSYFNGGPHLVLFGYYASRSPLSGGNPEWALNHYRQLKQMHGDTFLLTDLYYARYYLYYQQDREGFVSILNRIINKPYTVEKFRLYNKVAKDRAKIYLPATGRLFIE